MMETLGDSKAIVLLQMKMQKNSLKKSKESMQLKLDHLIRCNIDIP